MATTRFEFVGGSLCLDLANTVGGSRDGILSIEHLKSYGDLLVWCYEAALIDERDRETMDFMAKEDARGADRVLLGIRQIRDAIYQIFSSLARHENVPGSALAALNHDISIYFQRAQIISTSEGYVWGWKMGMSLDAMFPPIIWSTSDLLTSPSTVSRIRQCASPNCSWLFLDETKNHSRRWCNMKTCGNVNKIKQYRARQGAELRP